MTRIDAKPPSGQEMQDQQPHLAVCLTIVTTQFTKSDSAGRNLLFQTLKLLIVDHLQSKIPGHNACKGGWKQAEHVGPSCIAPVVCDGKQIRQNQNAEQYAC